MKVLQPLLKPDMITYSTDDDLVYIYAYILYDGIEKAINICFADTEKEDGEFDEEVYYHLDAPVKSARINAEKYGYDIETNIRDNTARVRIKSKNGKSFEVVFLFEDRFIHSKVWER